jgi:uncharacterized protein (TIGR02996 family)
MRTQDELNFLAAIRDDPDNDTVRLAYADYLDSLPQKYVRSKLATGMTEEDQDGNVYWIDYDTSNRDRAELIRVQVELAHHDPCEKCIAAHKRHVGSGKGICHGKAASIITQNGLLTTNSERWRKGPKCRECGGVGFAVVTGDFTKRTGRRSCPDCFGTGDAGGLTWLRYDGGTRLSGGGISGSQVIHTTHPVTYHRGMKRVHCAAADVWEQIVGDRDEPGDKDLKWCPTPWARVVCTHHPDVVELWVTDRELSVFGSGRAGLYNWDTQSTEYERAYERALIPGPIWDMLEGYDKDKIWDGRIYPNLETAMTQLARTTVLWIHNHLKGKS